MQSQQTQQQQLPAAAPTSPGSSSSSAAFERQRHRQHHNAAGELPGSWFVAFPSLAHLRVVGCGARGALHKLPLTAAKHLTSLVLSHNKLAGRCVGLSVRRGGPDVCVKPATALC
jgi:hypothetical protein